MSQSLMLTVTVLLTVLGAHAIDLPPSTAAISVILLTVTPHLQALLLKGELRIAGLALGTLWSLGTFLLVNVVPYFPLLVALIFLGQLIATYMTRTAGTYAYAGLQMGLVIPLVVVAPPSEFGSITPAVERLEGVLLGLIASIVVGSLWPLFPVAAKVPVAAPPPPPAMPGEIDV
jgi:hypothetical protein